LTTDNIDKPTNLNNANILANYNKIPKKIETNNICNNILSSISQISNIHKQDIKYKTKSNYNKLELNNFFGIKEDKQDKKDIIANIINKDKYNTDKTIDNYIKNTDGKTDKIEIPVIDITDKSDNNMIIDDTVRQTIKPDNKEIKPYYPDILDNVSENIDIDNTLISPEFNKENPIYNTNDNKNDSKSNDDNNNNSKDSIRTPVAEDLDDNFQLNSEPKSDTFISEQIIFKKENSK